MSGITYVGSSVSAADKAKLNRYVDFDTYAVGDGVTDDTAAWNTAIAALANGGTLRMGPKTYAAASVWNIPYDNVTIQGQAGATVVQATAANSAATLITATSRTNVHISGLTVDVNASARSGSPLNGILFSSCTDSDISFTIVKNAKGNSGFGMALAGAGLRCKAIGCVVENEGIDPTTSVADGIYTSGTENLIVGSIAVNCYDHGFVVEASNYSGISGCTSKGCGAGAGISATASDCRGNYIDGLTVGGWYATVTGGVDVLCTGAGNLFDTRVTGLTMAEPQVGATVALYVRQTGAGIVNGLEVSSFKINGAGTYGIAISDGAKNVRIGQGRIDSTFHCITIGDVATGCQHVYLSDLVLAPQSANGIYVRTGSDTIQFNDVHVIGKAGTTTVGVTLETGCTNILDGGVTGSDCSVALISGAGTTTIARSWVDVISTQAVGGAKTFSGTVEHDAAVGIGQAPSANSQLGITAAASNKLAIELTESGTTNTGLGFGSQGANGGLDHDHNTAAGVVRLGAHVRLDLGVTTGNYPWTFSQGLYVRSNGTITAAGVRKDPSADRAGLCLSAGTTGDAPLNIAQGTAKTSPATGDIELTSTNILATINSVRYDLLRAFGTTTVAINIPATALTLGGAPATNTGTVTGAVAGDLCICTPASAPDNDTVWDAYVSAADTVTVRVHALKGLTTTSTNYNVRVVKKP